MNFKILGHCQCCGRQQAVLNGCFMSNHGYTVEHGWFQGVCSGRNYRPIERCRKEADEIIASVRKDVEKLLDQLASVKAGLSFPKVVIRRSFDIITRKSTQVEVPFDEATVLERNDAVRTLERHLELKAQMGTSFADDLESIANKYHGQELVKQEKREREYIQTGEQRKSTEGVVYTCTAVKGARVYWSSPRASDGKVISSWMGSSAWRKLELV